MVISIVLGFVLIIGSVFIHAITTEICINSANKRVGKSIEGMSYGNKIKSISLLVYLLFFAAIIESMLWAMVYWRAGAIQDFQEAVYFSIVTYTTLGYGDITLNEQWRLLGAFQAANGIIIFGWSTAIVMSLVQRIFGKALHES